MWCIIVYMASQEERRKRILNTQGRYFERHPERLEEMFELRRKGMTFAAIGKLYGKDHTTIVHHCKKYGVVPDGTVLTKLETGFLYRTEKRVAIDQAREEIRRIKKKRMADEKVKYRLILEEPRAQGKLYSEYLKEKGIVLKNLDTEGDK